MSYLFQSQYLHSTGAVFINNQRCRYFKSVSFHFLIFLLFFFFEQRKTLIWGRRIQKLQKPPLSNKRKRNAFNHPKVELLIKYMFGNFRTLAAFVSFVKCYRRCQGRVSKSVECFQTEYEHNRQMHPSVAF